MTTVALTVELGFVLPKGANVDVDAVCVNVPPGTLELTVIIVLFAGAVEVTCVDDAAVLEPAFLAVATVAICDPAIAELLVVTSAVDDAIHNELLLVEPVMVPTCVLLAVIVLPAKLIGDPIEALKLKVDASVDNASTAVELLIVLGLTALNTLESTVDTCVDVPIADTLETTCAGADGNPMAGELLAVFVGELTTGMVEVTGKTCVDEGPTMGEPLAVPVGVPANDIVDEVAADILYWVADETKVNVACAD
ncbi:hypothetical protein HDU90_002338 [Geranomyces variabilis]|nr:hypothetical protein HDU90_002338 [Geranomyces variabilis]